MARPQTKPPHPATVAQKKAAPAKKAKPPHPATVAQTKAAPAKKAKPPHPATVAQTKAAPAKKERPPHPATVAQKAAAPRKPAKPPHPAAAKTAAKKAAGGGGSAPALTLGTGFFLIHDYGGYYLIVEPHQGKHCAGVWPGYNKKKGTILDGVSPGNLDLLKLLWDAATSEGSKPPAAQIADLDVETKGGTVRIQAAQGKAGGKTAYFIHAYPR